MHAINVSGTFYINLSHGGLATNCPFLRDFTFQTFSMLEIISPLVMKKIKSASIRNVNEQILFSLNDTNVDFVRKNHCDWAKSLHCALPDV